MMMQHLLESEPNKHVFLNVENNIWRPIFLVFDNILINWQSNLFI